MKAVVYTEFGSPDVLQLTEMQRPSPRDDEVLIRVHAASVNFSDPAFMRGEPFAVRLMGAGLFRPRNGILGADIAGRVEAVGRNATQFRPGDAVIGDISECGWGGFAEYVCARESALAAKPANAAFEEVAAVPQTEVTGVCGIRNLDMVRSIFDYRRALNPHGVYVMVGGSGPQMLQAMLLGPWISLSGSRRMDNLASRPNLSDLQVVKELIESGKVEAVIDRRYPLSQVAEAIRYYEEGHARGKVVISVAPAEGND